MAEKRTVTIGDHAGHLITASLAVLAAGIAWRLRWIQDDAFIAFQYARSLAEGHGPTWFGERVDGYANPLWVLLIAAAISIHVDPILASHTLGIGCLAGTVVVASRIYRDTFRSRAVAIVALVLMTSNYSFLAYGTGGLGTMSVTLWMTGAIALTTSFLRRPRRTTSRNQLFGLSVYLALGVLVRYDLVVVSLAAACVLLWHMKRRSELDRSRFHAIALPLFGCMASFFAARWFFYGTFLPNLFHAKAATGSIENGVVYLARFLDAYWLWPLLGAGIWSLVRRARGSHAIFDSESVILPAVLLTSAWILYVIAVGGDFMEFRMIVPALPAVALLSAAGIAELTTLMPWRIARPAALVLAVAAAATRSVHHARDFRGITDDKTLDSVAALRTFYGLHSDDDWELLGTALRREIGDQGVVLATSACGAIPYYSRITTIDMCGLNDAHVARNGIRADDSYRRPGHRLAASRKYLRDRGVHLILGHPHVVPRGLLSSQLDLQYWFGVIAQMSPLDSEYVGHAHVVAMPIDSSRSIVMWYYRAHPAVDAKLSTGEWEQRLIWPGF